MDKNIKFTYLNSVLSRVHMSLDATSSGPFPPRWGNTVDFCDLLTCLFRPAPISEMVMLWFLAMQRGTVTSCHQVAAQVVKVQNY